MFRNKMVLRLILVVSLGLDSSWVMGKKPAGSEQQVVSSGQKGTKSVQTGKARVEVKSEQKDTKMVAEAQTVELKPIMEYKFDEPIIDVIFDETTMTVKEARALGMKGLEQKKVTEKVKMKYPKVLVTKKSVKFLDEKGKVLKSISKEEGQRVDFSLKTGNMVISGWSREKKVEGGYKCAKLINHRGEVVKKVEGGEFFGAHLSGNGRYVLVGEGIFSLYDANNGKELWKKNLGWVNFTDIDEGVVHILYDGKVVVAKRTGMIAETINGRTQSRYTKGVIALIDTDGKKLWEHEIEIAEYEILSTKDGKIIVYAEDITYAGRIIGDLSTARYILYGFDKNGRFLWQPKGYKGFNNSFHNLSVSKDGDYLMGFTLWSHIWVMDINTGEFIWKYPFSKLPLQGYKPDFSEISQNGIYILLEDVDIEKIILLDRKSNKVSKPIERREKWEDFREPIWRFLGKDQILRKGSKIEIFSISDILKEKD